MRPLEILFAVFIVIAILLRMSLVSSRWRMWISGLGVSLSAMLQWRFEGIHWQIFSLYLAGFFALVVVALGAKWPKWLIRIAGSGCLFLVFVSVVASWIMPMFRLPKPTGPHAVGTRILYLVDRNRAEENGPSPSGRRELMVQAWYPTEPSKRVERPLAVYQRREEVTLRASYRSVLRTNSYVDAPVAKGGPYPVLIYSPGWMGERTEGTFQMEELASHGFVVLAIDHTFFGGLVEFPDGRVEDSRGMPALGNFEHSTIEEQWALGTKFVRIEAQDNSFVLDELERLNQDSSSPWFHQLDISRVGVFGFSIGGAAAEQTAFQDPRVRAAINLDGWTFGDAAHGLSKPLMVIYEDRAMTVPTVAELHAPEVADRLFWQASADDFHQVSVGMETNGGYMLFLSDTHHVDFTDRSLFSPLRSLTGGGSADPTTVHTIINAYTLAFFEQSLEGRSEPLLEATHVPCAGVEFHRYLRSKL
jgi:predicted dienelactone hydrolase